MKLLSIAFLRSITVRKRRQKLVPKLLITKVLRVMHLTAICLFLCLLQATANTNAQKITLKLKNVTLENALRSIEKQSGVTYIGKKGVLGRANKVTVNVTEVTIEEALTACFKDQPFSFSINGKFISIITPTGGLNPRLLSDGFSHRLSPLLIAPPVTGVVRGPDGQPLSGVNIVVKGTKRGVTTNPDGSFSIDAKEGDVLVISNVGYEVSEVTVGTNNSIGLIALVIKNKELEQVVVQKGYYKSSKELNTGSVATLRAADIEKQPVNDPLMALAGRITGLYVSNTSGIPGSKINIDLRGRNSLSNRTEPLFIVDGIPFNYTGLGQLVNAAGAAQNSSSPFTSIRPGDIESIDVLKDADATAIYGSRGANGVILITTKKGRAGKTRVYVNVSTGASRVASRLKLLNTSQYLGMRKQAKENSAEPLLETDYDLNGTWDPSRYTDWQDVLVGGTASTIDAKGTVSGGNDHTQYVLGLGYRKENFVYPGDFSNKIGSGNFDIRHTSENGRFTLSLTTNYSRNENNLPQDDLAQYVYLSPNAPKLYDNNGELNWQNNTFNNPYQFLLRTANTETDNLLNNLNLSYKIIAGLFLKGNLGYNSTQFNEQNVTPYSSIMPLPSNNAAALRGKNVGFNNIQSYILEPQLTYFFTIEKHYFDALVGTTFNESNQEGFRANSLGYQNDALILNSAVATSTFNSNSSSQYRYNALFFRVGYNYEEKYILNFTGRRDGSSRFGPGKQFGNFGAIGAAWLMHKENFLKRVNRFVSMAKLRGSVGKTGNDQFPDYEYLSTYTARTFYDNIAGLEPTRIANPTYSWEVNNKVEGALELGVLNDRIVTSIAFYRNRTNNQLVNYTLPRSTGFPGIRANLPAVIQNSGWEFELSARIFNSPDFTWNSEFNLSVPKNKLISYPNFESSSFTNTYAVGMPLNVKYLYHFTGLNEQTGVYRYEDVSGDGNIGFEDLVPVVVGRKYYGGFNNSITYKGIQLDVFFQYVKQTAYQFVSNRIPGFFDTDALANQPLDVLSSWKQSGDRGPYSQLSSTANDAAIGTSLYSQSDAVIGDASFIRLKNVALSYQLPNRWLNYLKIKSVRIYAQGQNLLTISSFKGLDPETAAAGSPVLAPLRVLTAGVQLSL